jgi:hypothetical protein
MKEGVSALLEYQIKKKNETSDEVKRPLRVGGCIAP